MTNKNLLTLSISFFLFTGLFSQENDIVSFFNGQVFNDNVVLSWNIKQGDNCNGINILHSIDGQNFTEIGNIPGICGAVDESEPYQFVHEDPVPLIVNYYKLNLGGQGSSSVLAINFYRTGESGFVFFPNPSSDHISIYIDGSYKDASIEIIDSNGRLIFDESLLSGEVKQISTLELSAGTYLIRLRNDDELISSERFIQL